MGEKGHLLGHNQTDTLFVIVHDQWLSVLCSISVEEGKHSIKTYRRPFQNPHLFVRLFRRSSLRFHTDSVSHFDQDNKVIILVSQTSVVGHTD